MYDGIEGELEQLNILTSAFSLSTSILIAYNRLFGPAYSNFLYLGATE